MLTGLQLLLCTAIAAVTVAAVVPGSLHRLRSSAAFPGIPTQPKSNPKLTVQCTNDVRITLVAPTVARFEQSASGSGSFEERASMLAINRTMLDDGWSLTVNNSTKQWCNISVHAGKGVDTHIDTISLLKQGATPQDMCASAKPGRDVVCDGKCQRVQEHPNGTVAASLDDCCSACTNTSDCTSWVYADGSNDAINCWLLAGKTVTGTKSASSRTCGGRTGSSGDDFKNKLWVTGHWPGGTWQWMAGQNDTLNLNGTLRRTPSADLAGCCDNSHGWDPKYPLMPGLISRSGWAVIDDTNNPLLDSSGWILPPNVTRASSTDLYLFGCGRNYQACLKDFTRLSGPIAMPPRAAFGIWWSRHWGSTFEGQPFGPESEENVMSEVVDGYAQHELPLHVVVLDMEFHTMLSPTDCETFIGVKGWGGYTWNRTLFHDPEAFVAKLHARNISLSLNFHPDNGIDHCQIMYYDMATRIGFDTSTNATIIDLNQNSLDRNYVGAYFDVVIANTSVDYSWTDSPKVSAWTNSLYCMNMERTNKRPLVLSRYGGLGNHRAPIGFSGDTLRKWDTLAYEVYMTPIASNIAFGYWSHDIGGFSGSYVDPEHHTESPELFLRWLQFAAFAPIFRTHCRYCEQRIWTFGADYFPLMRHTMMLRNALVPYIYTLSSQAYRSGLSPLRRLYYEWPEHDESYEYELEYAFGDAFVVAPVTQPVNPATNTTPSTEIWLPPGEWFDWISGSVLSGPKVLNRTYQLQDIPVFSRSGALVPMRLYQDRYAKYLSTQVWQLFPGAQQGQGYLYEDDGETMDYIKGNQSDSSGICETHARFEQLDKATVTFTADTGCSQSSRSTALYLLLPAMNMPDSVTCNSHDLKPSSTPVDSPGFFWKAANATLTGHDTSTVFVSCPSSSLASQSVRIQLPSMPND